jgi:hypothetical protein
MTDTEMIKIYIQYGEMFDYDYYPNEPAGKLSEEQIAQLYKKCIETGKPWRTYVKDNTKPGEIL